METDIHKSKRKKPNESSPSPKKINEKPEELDKRNNSNRIKQGLSKTSRKKQTTLSIACKVETEAVEDPDVLIIDDGKESPSERSPIPGKSDLLSLLLQHFCLFNPSFSLFNTCSLQHSSYICI